MQGARLFSRSTRMQPAATAASFGRLKNYQTRQPVRPQGPQEANNDHDHYNSCSAGCMLV